MVPSNGEPQIFQVVRGKIPPAMKMALSLGDFSRGYCRGHESWDLFWGIKQCKYRVILREIPYKCALFGLVI